MENEKTTSSSPDQGTPSGQKLPLSLPPTGVLARYPWLTFLLPFIVFWLVGTLEPTASQPGGSWIGLSIAYENYPAVYTAKIIATLLAMLAVSRGYLAFPLRVSPLGVIVGVVGVFFWLGLCRLKLEMRWLEPIGLGSFLGLGERSGYNPLVEISDSTTWAHAFLVIRFIGLALVVPVMEEFFLRGFLMRYVMAHKWWEIPFGEADTTAIIAGTVVPMLMHPAELFAAAVWFSLVTWLMLRTKNIWECVVAHVVTNLLLGFYVVYYDHWELM